MANERARCYVEPPVTVTPEGFLWLISIPEGETTPETTRSHRSPSDLMRSSAVLLKKRARAALSSRPTARAPMKRGYLAQRATPVL